ncbi:cobalt-precorrin-6A reductase [Terasakiispira papahanaumokuakeensis]|uniref:Cobalt-precorrin-6A reductase n=1 Tax=Terasakiispira papahanaumokuakeensis TaxID=197479 RepID=A0A1E2VER8_9GAMM|nr:cobalt-precorrin-6A reductase [Terasakiispira papahanaumokuakeensis]ODC05500.1 cobalt-precorrin-6A reductase [Terasakiispira papahanaumokuakeensis]
MSHVLILGGTTEANALAATLAQQTIPATFSYAGRTRHPKVQPLPTRIGGFGGAEGLVTYIQQHHISHVVDATHPFAAQMSQHAWQAAQTTATPLIALTRPPWQPQPGDQWHSVADFDAALAALKGPAERVFVATGRQHLAAFAAQPQHRYWVRLVDIPTTPLPPFDITPIIDRGPFTHEGDLALLREYQIQRLVCKNAGGQGASAKLSAARQLGLPVIMINRPALPPRKEVHTPDAVLDWLYA